MDEQVNEVGQQVQGESSPASGGTDGQDARPTIDPGPAPFRPAVGRVVLVRSPLYGRRAHEEECELLLDEAGGDRSKVKLPEFRAEVRPGRILRVCPGGLVDVTVDLDPARDAIDSVGEIVRAECVCESEPSACEQVVVFVPPRV
ncbi:MAG: hypothetical protein ACNA8P_12470 [Phycisphaerales bacterium]